MLMTINPAMNGWAIFSEACRVMAKRLRDVCGLPESDPLWHASHYVKVMLDQIFDGKNETAKYVEYAKSFLEIRSCISRGSRSICLGAQGKSAEMRK